MREISCRACGREIKSVMKFCPYCGSTDIINSAFSNVNNSYSSRSVNPPQYNQYSTNYQNNAPRKNNYSNNMYGNNMSSNGNKSYNGYSNTMYMGNNQNNNSNYNTGYKNSRYNSYNSTQSTNNDTTSSNPYIANKNYYTKQSQQFTGTNSTYDNNSEYEEEKKGISSWQMGLAAFAAILVVGLGVLYFTGTFDSFLNKTETTKTADKESTNNVIATGSSANKYEIGELKDDTYTNKWSNVVIKVPEGYSNKSEDGYNMYKTDYMECGLYLENESGESIVNLYVDLENDDGSFSEAAFIDESKVNYKSSGMEIVSSTDYSTMNICGNDYTYSHIVMKSGEATITQSVFVRQQDKNACIFIITNVGENVEKTYTILKSFTSCSG